MAERWREKAEFAATVLRNAARDYHRDHDSPAPDVTRELERLSREVRQLAQVPGTLVIDRG